MTCVPAKSEHDHSLSFFFFLTMKEKNLKYINASTKRSFGILLQVGNIPAQSVFTNENRVLLEYLTAHLKNNF